MRYSGPVFDNHFHLREDGLFREAARAFKAAGGTALNIVNLPDPSVGLDRYYERVYERTLRIADAIREDVGLQVMVTLGPYPLDLLMFSGAGRDPEMEVMRGAELAIKLYSEGLCSCIGEVGLPHFRVSDEHMDLSWKLLGQILSMAADEGAPVMLHTMDLGADGYRRIEGLTVSAGMDRRRVVKHHALPQDLLLGTEIRISLLATRPNIRHWISVRKPAFLETDYVDDPSKPGKVIPPDSVPKRVRMAEQECEDCEELLHSAFHDLPAEVYSVDFS